MCSQELHFQKGYGFVHFPYTPEGVASALKCCEELHNRTVDKVTYKCNISHRLKQCMNGGVSDEEAYGTEYEADYGAYPQVVMMNPMGVPGIPVGYAYNSAGVMVPLAMAMPVGDPYQYMNPFVAMSQYQNQFQQQGQMQAQQGPGQGQTQQGQNMSPPFGPMATPQMFPYAFPQPYAQVPGMLNMMSYPQGGYYNQLGAVAGPYSWQYPYCNSAGEQSHLGGASAALEQSPQGSQQGQHHKGSQSAHAASASAADSTANTIVTGFAVQKPTAAAIAAAVHGDAGFMYATPGSVGAYAHSIHHGADGHNYGFHNQHYTAHGYDQGQSAHAHHQHQGHHSGGGEGNGQSQHNGSNTKTWAALFANNNSNSTGSNHGYGHGNAGNGYSSAHAQLSASPMVAFLPAAVNGAGPNKMPFTSVGPSAQYSNGVYPRPRSGSSSASPRAVRTTPITTVQRSSRSPPSTTSASEETKAGAGGAARSLGSPGKRDAAGLGMEVISGVKSPDSDLSEPSYGSSQHTTSEDTALDSTPVLPEALLGVLGDAAGAGPGMGGAMEMAVTDAGAEAGLCGAAMVVVGEGGGLAQVA